jgi:hypothetical protein
MVNESENAQAAAALAGRLFPHEIWNEAVPGVYIAENRQPRGKNQRQILTKELIQARILADLGNVVYLLPEIGISGAKHADAVVNGWVMEFKTITGNIRKVAENFKSAIYDDHLQYTRILTNSYDLVNVVLNW